MQASPLLEVQGGLLGIVYFHVVQPKATKATTDVGPGESLFIRLTSPTINADSMLTEPDAHWTFGQEVTSWSMTKYQGVLFRNNLIQ